LHACKEQWGEHLIVLAGNFRSIPTRLPGGIFKRSFIARQFKNQVKLFCREISGHRG